MTDEEHIFSIVTDELVALRQIASKADELVDGKEISLEELRRLVNRWKFLRAELARHIIKPGPSETK